MALATTTLALYGVGGAALATSLVKLRRRFELSQAKHKSLAGHARIARRLAAFVPFYEYDEARFFCSDDAPADIAERRRAGFERLSALYKARFAETIRRTAEAADTAFPICNSPTPTGCRSNTAAMCAATCPPPPSCNRAPA